MKCLALTFIQRALNDRAHLDAAVQLVARDERDPMSATYRSSWRAYHIAYAALSSAYRAYDVLLDRNAINERARAVRAVEWAEARLPYPSEFAAPASPLAYLAAAWTAGVLKLIA